MAGTSKFQEWISEDGLQKIENWARSGMTDIEIATEMGINRKTLCEWKIKHKVIGNALKMGKDIVDNGVEDSLLNRAMGYSFIETTRERVFNKATEEYEFVVTKTVEKQMAADVTACIFWLKNRRPNLWRNREDIHLTNDLEDLTPLAELLK